MVSFRIAAVLSLFAASCQAATINSDYFAWPLKAAAVPEVHNGDTLNVTWKSTWSQASLYHWCGGTLLQTLPGLGGDGNRVFVVNSSWTSPCHWQFVSQTDTDIYVDSGWIDVTNVKATPAVTWVPSATGEACGLQTTTVTAAAAASVAATSDAAANAVSSSTAACTGCTDAAHGPKLGVGAGVGIGLAVGLAVAGITTAIWLPLRRRHLGTTSMDSQESSQAQQQMDQRPAEADGQVRSEIDGTGKVGVSTLSELPSSPNRRST